MNQELRKKYIKAFQGVFENLEEPSPDREALHTQADELIRDYVKHVVGDLEIGDLYDSITNECWYS